MKNMGASYDRRELVGLLDAMTTKWNGPKQDALFRLLLLPLGFACSPKMNEMSMIMKKS